MHSANIQMELLSEVITPQQVLNYAKKERQRTCEPTGETQSAFQLKHSVIRPSEQTTK